MADRIVSVNPATGEVLGEVSQATQEEVSQAVEVARRAQEKWGGFSPRERSQRLRWVLEALTTRMDEVARLITMEQGKTLPESYSLEVYSVLEGLDFAVNKAWRYLMPRGVKPWAPIFASHRMEIRYEPLGVVALVSPWNYPLAVPFLEAASALVAGNSVVFKPSPFASLSGAMVGELFQVEGIPEGLVQVVHGGGGVGHWLVTHPGISGVFFTGSRETGRKVYQAVSPGLKKLVLELEGKDPAIVLADADMEYSVQGILWAAMVNAGQSCASIELVLVHSAIFDRFVSTLAEKARGVRVGNPLEPDIDMGPISNRPQYKKVLGYLEEAREAGVEVLGGEAPEGKGFFIRPAIVVNPPRGLKVMVEEVFGPVVSVIPFHEVEEAVSFVNNLSFGLTASVWTTNPSCGERFAQHLRYGVVTVNDHIFTFAEPQLPWGGFRDSGLGRSHGLPGLMELVEPKSVARIYRYRPRLWWYPYGKDLVDIMKVSMKGFFSASLVRRWKELLSLLLKKRVRERVDLKDFLIKGALRLVRALMGR